jgi:CHAT domain-containing protein/tetratricopeptide (TPR) repeat protein
MTHTRHSRASLWLGWIPLALSLVLIPVAPLTAQPDLDWAQLTDLAERLAEDERYDSAVVIGQQACLRLASSPSHSDSMEVLLLVRQAEYLEGVARFDSAQTCLARADSLARPMRDSDPWPWARCLIAWAEMKVYLSKYPEAESYFSDAIRQYSSRSSPPAREQARALAGLGNLYFRTDRPVGADSLLHQALAIQQNHLPPDDPDKARVIGRLAMVASDLGRVEQVEPLLLESIAILERHYGVDHSRVAQMLANLGMWYDAQDRRKESIELQERALRIREKALGPDNPKLAFPLVNLAVAYRNDGQNLRALPLLRRAYDLRLQSFGPTHHYTTLSLNHLAGIFEVLGMLDSAEALRRRQVEVLPQVMPEGHIEQIRALVDLAVVLLREGKTGEALLVAHGALEKGMSRFRLFAPSLSDYEALLVSTALHGPLDVMLSCVKSDSLLSDSAVSLAADAVIAVKGEFADELFRRAVMARLAGQAELEPVVDSLLGALGQLQRIPVTTLSLRTDQEIRQLDSLERRVRRLERQIAEQAHQLKAQTLAAVTDAKELTRRLKDHSVALEFVAFHDRTIPSFTPSMRYAALVLRPGQAPAFQILGEASTIDSLAGAYQAHLSQFSESGRLPSHSSESDYRALSARLYEAVWAPVESLVGTSSQVLVSPDAALNSISLESLATPDGGYLLERHAFQYLDAMRDLAATGEDEPQGSGLLAMGDPDFDAQPASVAANSWATLAGGARLAAQAHAVTRSTCAGLTEEKVAALPGTAPEIERAVQEWQRRTQSPAAAHAGRSATEEAFKASAPGKYALHLATHGFAFTGRCLEELAEIDKISQRVFVQENPLLLSGLLLAGANGDPRVADSLGIEDGILSAYEIAGMNLEGVQWAILSACESGLGIARAHEGLFGVRRAFHMAGVKTVLSALWPVPDAATQGLMRSLYEHPTDDLAARLRMAQLDQIRSLRRNGLSTHPYSWGAFIASGRP